MRSLEGSNYKVRWKDGWDQGQDPSECSHLGWCERKQVGKETRGFIETSE